MPVYEGIKIQNAILNNKKLQRDLSASNDCFTTELNNETLFLRGGILTAGRKR